MKHSKRPALLAAAEYLGTYCLMQMQVERLIELVREHRHTDITAIRDQSQPRCFKVSVAHNNDWDRNDYLNLAAFVARAVTVLPEAQHVA